MLTRTVNNLFREFGDPSLCLTWTTLKFPVMTSKFHTVKLFDAELLSMFSVCTHSKFYMSTSKHSLVIGVKPKTECRFRDAAMLVYII